MRGSKQKELEFKIVGWVNVLYDQCGAHDAKRNADFVGYLIR
jgi:hypothetical protein